MTWYLLQKLDYDNSEWKEAAGASNPSELFKSMMGKTFGAWRIIDKDSGLQLAQRPMYPPSLISSYSQPIAQRTGYSGNPYESITTQHTKPKQKFYAVLARNGCFESLDVAKETARILSNESVGGIKTFVLEAIWSTERKSFIEEGDL